MAVLTTLAQLEEVQTAITAVMGGQSYRIGDIQFERADLGSLQKRETALLMRYRREQRGSMRVRPNFSAGV